MHAGFGHVGMMIKIFVLIQHMTHNQCQLDKSFNLFSDAAIHAWEMYVLYNPDGIVRYSVIHCLRLINSAQLCYKKFQSIP